MKGFKIFLLGLLALFSFSVCLVAAKTVPAKQKTHLVYCQCVDQSFPVATVQVAGHLTSVTTIGKYVDTGGFAIASTATAQATFVEAHTGQGSTIFKPNPWRNYTNYSNRIRPWSIAGNYRC